MPPPITVSCWCSVLRKYDSMGRMSHLSENIACLTGRMRLSKCKWLKPEVGQKVGVEVSEVQEVGFYAYWTTDLVPVLFPIEVLPVI